MWIAEKESESSLLQLIILLPGQDMVVTQFSKKVIVWTREEAISRGKLMVLGPIGFPCPFLELAL